MKPLRVEKTYFAEILVQPQMPRKPIVHLAIHTMKKIQGGPKATPAYVACVLTVKPMNGESVQVMLVDGPHGEQKINREPRTKS